MLNYATGGATLALALLLAETTTFDLAARADTFPSRPVKIIVPYPPGGPIDTIGRLMAEALPERLGGQAYVENVAGAAGVIGMRAAASAQADGHTLVVANENLVIQPIIKSDARFDPITSFSPIALVASAPMVIAIHPSLPATNWSELVSVLKAGQGKYNFASAGLATSPHLASERLFNLTLALNLRHVPFQGAAGAVQAVLSGQVPIFHEVLPAIAPHINQGTMRGIAVAATARTKSLPDVPTLAELGVPQHEVSFWCGILVPAGVSNEVSARLQHSIAAALESVPVRTRLTTMGFDVVASSRTAFAAHIASEKNRYVKLVADIKLKVE